MGVISSHEGALPVFPAATITKIIIDYEYYTIR